MRLLIPMLFVLSLCAQPPQEGGKQDGGRKGGGPPRNLKVLKLQGRELGAKMQTFSVGLGVRCDYCHVQDRASDENPKKEIARHMITMVEEINAKFPDGKEHVTCYTCHRGESEPKMVPPPAAPPAQ